MSSNKNVPSNSSETHIDESTLSHETPIVPSSSSSASHNHPSPRHNATPAASYLDIPSASFRRSSTSSFDSAFTDLSELSITSADLQPHHPLINSHDLLSSQRPLTLKSRISSKLHQFYHLNYGALLVLLAQFFGTLMNLSTRILEHPGPHGPGMHPFQILFARQSITSLTCTVWALSTGRIPDFPLGPRDLKVRMLLVCRGVCGFLGVFGMYFSLLYLPLSEATVLTFLAPVLTCYLCGWLMPGETFSRQQQVAGLVSLSGVVFIARPVSFFSHSGTGDVGEGDGGGQHASNSTVPETAPVEGYATPHPTSSQHLIAVAISLVGVVGSTGAMTSIRAIGNRAHPFLSINYFSVFCTLMSLICLLVFKDVKFRLPGNWTEWGLLASLGACGFVMQWLLTRGLSYGSAGSAQPNVQTSRETPRVGVSGKAGASDDALEDIELGDSTREHAVGSSKRNSSSAEMVAPTKSYADGKEAPIKGSGNRATSMVYTQMLFALAGDKLVFGVTPGTMSWIGSGLILAGAIWVASARDKDSAGQRRHTGAGVGVGASEEARATVEGTAAAAAASAVARDSRMRLYGGRDRQDESNEREEAVGLLSDIDIDDPL